MTFIHIVKITTAYLISYNSEKFKIFIIAIMTKYLNKLLELKIRIKRKCKVNKLS